MLRKAALRVIPPPLLPQGPILYPRAVICQSNDLICSQLGGNVTINPPSSLADFLLLPDLSAFRAHLFLYLSCTRRVTIQEPLCYAQGYFCGQTQYFVDIVLAIAQMFSGGETANEHINIFLFL